MSKKLLFTLIGVAVLCFIVICWLKAKVTDVGLWALWFGAFTTNIGVYTAANVRQKKIISQNYNEKLDNKFIEFASKNYDEKSDQRGKNE